MQYTRTESTNRATFLGRSSLTGAGHSPLVLMAPPGSQQRNVNLQIHLQIPKYPRSFKEIFVNIKPSFASREHKLYHYKHKVVTVVSPSIRATSHLGPCFPSDLFLEREHLKARGPYCVFPNHSPDPAASSPTR